MSYYTVIEKFFIIRFSMMEKRKKDRPEGQFNFSKKKSKQHLQSLHSVKKLPIKGR